MSGMQEADSPELMLISNSDVDLFDSDSICYSQFFPAVTAEGVTVFATGSVLCFVAGSPNGLVHNFSAHRAASYRGVETPMIHVRTANVFFNQWRTWFERMLLDSTISSGVASRASTVSISKIRSCPASGWFPSSATMSP